MRWPFCETAPSPNNEDEYVDCDDNDDNNYQESSSIDCDIDIEVVLEWQYGVANQPGNQIGYLHNPRGCALSADGQLLYVTDGNNHRVVALCAANGEFVREFGAAQGLDFNVPWGIAMGSSTASSAIWVSDRDNNRVQCFDAHNGHLIRVLGHMAEECSMSSEEFSVPRGIALHDGLLFVSDDENHRVQVFLEESGKYLHSIGAPAGGGHSDCQCTCRSGDGQLNRPQGLAVDPVRNLLYVSEYGNKRVSVFDIARNQENKFSFGFQGTLGRAGKGDGEFQCPIGIGLDSTRSLLYVFDYDLQHANVWSAFH